MPERTTPPPKTTLAEADRALRDLAKRLEGRDENDSVRLTVRDIRAMLFKFYGVEGKARKALKLAAMG